MAENQSQSPRVAIGYPISYGIAEGYPVDIIMNSHTQHTASRSSTGATESQQTVPLLVTGIPLRSPDSGYNSFRRPETGSTHPGSNSNDDEEEENETRGASVQVPSFMMIVSFVIVALLLGCFMIMLILLHTPFPPKIYVISTLADNFKFLSCDVEVVFGMENRCLLGGLEYNFINVTLYHSKENYYLSGTKIPSFGQYSGEQPRTILTKFHLEKQPVHVGELSNGVVVKDAHAQFVVVDLRFEFSAMATYANWTWTARRIRLRAKCNEVKAKFCVSSNKTVEREEFSRSGSGYCSIDGKLWTIASFSMATAVGLFAAFALLCFFCIALKLSEVSRFLV